MSRLRPPSPHRLPLWAALLGGALLLAACGGGGGRPTPPPGGALPLQEGPFALLVFSRTSGFRHTSIEVGQQALRELAAENDFAVEFTEDPSVFTPEGLAPYAAVLWLNTTLTVLDEPSQRQAFEDFIAAGGGYVGVHSAADTEYDWPFYGELVGAYFLAHPVLNQPGTLYVEDPGHPSTDHLGPQWSLPLEEFYSFRTNPREEVRVLLRLEESGLIQDPNTSCDPSGPTFPQGYSAVMGDHPLAWCHDRLGGRAWYTALGHEAYLYQLPDFREHLLEGILTATRRVPAQCAPLPPPPDLPPYQPPVLEGCENQLLPG